MAALLRTALAPVASTPRLPWEAYRSLFLAGGKIRRRFPSPNKLAAVGSKGTRQEQYEKQRAAYVPPFFKTPVDTEGLPLPATRFHPFIPPNFRIVERCVPGMAPPPMRPGQSGAIGNGGRTARLKASMKAHLRRVRRNKPSGVYS